MPGHCQIVAGGLKLNIIHFNDKSYRKGWKSSPLHFPANSVSIYLELHNNANFLHGNETEVSKDVSSHISATWSHPFKCVASITSNSKRIWNVALPFLSNFLIISKSLLLLRVFKVLHLVFSLQSSPILNGQSGNLSFGFMYLLTDFFLKKLNQLYHFAICYLLVLCSFSIYNYWNHSVISIEL